MATVHVSRRRVSPRKIVFFLCTVLPCVYLVERLVIEQRTSTQRSIIEAMSPPIEADSPESRIYEILDQITATREQLSARYDELGINDDMLERAILGRKYAQTLERLKNILTDVIFNGRTFRIGILGGSISAGAYLANIDQMYANIYARLLRNVFGTPVEVHNGAVGACGSNYFSYCAPVHLDVENMDLILTEFAVNDNLDTAVAHERLVRNVLSSPNRPQLLYVHFMLGKMMRELGRCFNAEAFVLTPMSRHYNIPSISFRKAVCPALNSSSDKIFTPGDNYNHPGEQGHELTALILFYFTTNFIQNICGRLLHQMRISNSFSQADSLPENNLNDMEVLPSPLFQDTHDVKFECRTTLQPRLSEDSYLTPVYNRGWEVYYPDMPKTRNDVATSWYTAAANKTIAFDIDMQRFGSTAVCNVTLLTMTCQSGGKARAFLSKHRSKQVIANTQDIYRKMRLIHVIENIPADDNTLVVKTTEDNPFHLVGVATSCDNTIRLLP
ncbi:uncharacterized protein [Ptychodera flava]